MDDLMYNRQQNIELKIPETVSIVGCGGVGAWVAIFLALSGIRHFKLFDSDVLEIHNLNRLPFTQSNVGQLKKTILKNFLTSIRKNCFVEEYPHIDELSVNLLSGYVVDCTDAPKIQQTIYSFCLGNKLPYYRVGCDSNHITILTSLKELWGKDDESGYEIIPNYVVPPVLSAIITVHAILKKNFDVTILGEIDKVLMQFGGSRIGSQIKF